MVESVDYVNAFIACSEDSTATEAVEPPGPGSVAAMTWQMISHDPYRYTSGDVIFAVYADRHGIPEPERAAARQEFYWRGQPCLRTSDLGRRYGWGIHADDQGRVALVPVGTPEYDAFAAGHVPGSSGTEVKVVPAMRRTRARTSSIRA